MEGLVHVYTGDGKGKTTAAVGLGVRAYGRGMKVLLIQFLKGMETGELRAVKAFGSGFEIARSKEIVKFTWQMDEHERKETEKMQVKLFEKAQIAAAGGEKNLIILDEIMAAIKAGMIRKEDVLKFVENKPANVELVLTGRQAPKELIELADYVSEIKAVKHPMEKGIKARKGIEN